MKRGLVGLVLLSVIWACGEDTTSAPSSSGVFGGTSDAGSTAGVECTHPGAGRTIGGDRCECSSSRKIAGDWSAKRTCREGTSCPVKDEDESLRLTLTGDAVRGEIGPAGAPTFTFTGTLCGDFIVWTGARAAGGTECGQLRLADDNHYFMDSCYVASGECRPNFGQGCPSEKGQCTGTGARKPEAAAAIVKDVCN